MTTIPVHVYVGIGGWKAHAKVNLIACPHVGDFIEVKGHTVECERVYITEDYVQVEETIRFQSEQEAKEYFSE